MKFCKMYREYMEVRGKELPGLGLKPLKKILSRCRRVSRPQARLVRQQLLQSVDEGEKGGGESEGSSSLPVTAGVCLDHCPGVVLLHPKGICPLVCDGTFFPALLNEMSVIVGCFNERARGLLELHLASGFWKFYVWFKGKLQRGHHSSLIQDGKDLVSYAIINSVAMRKILKKYDKIHNSKQGQLFRSHAQSMHIEILRSPWLCELLAFYINLRGNKVNTGTDPGLFVDCFLKFDGGRPTLSCALLDSLKLEINLTCSICLDTVFDPVFLRCGHIFCYMCCCSAASVSIVDGVKAADPHARCPLCRRAGVYEGAAHLGELSILLSQSCPEYWEKRLQSEREERIRQVKEYWDSQCRAFTGV